MSERIELYKIISKDYWDNEYKENGTLHVTHNAGSDQKTLELAKKEMDLFLFPSKEKCDSLLKDEDGNPHPTFGSDFFLHPPVEKFGVALDYGCGGFARYSIEMSKYFDRVYGVDISSEGIMDAKKRVKNQKIQNVLLMCNDGVSVPLGDCSVDFVFSNLVLQHIGNIDVHMMLIKEFKRVLRPGGMVRLEYLDGSSRKSDDFFNFVEGNGIGKDELEDIYVEHGFKPVCITESKGFTWITATK